MVALKIHNLLFYKTLSFVVIFSCLAACSAESIQGIESADKQTNEESKNEVELESSENFKRDRKSSTPDIQAKTYPLPVPAPAPVKYSPVVTPHYPTHTGYQATHQQSYGAHYPTPTEYPATHQQPYGAQYPTPTGYSAPHQPSYGAHYPTPTGYQETHQPSYGAHYPTSTGYQAVHQPSYGSPSSYSGQYHGRPISIPVQIYGAHPNTPPQYGVPPHITMTAIPIHYGSSPMYRALGKVIMPKPTQPTGQGGDYYHSGGGYVQAGYSNPEYSHGGSYQPPNNHGYGYGNYGPLEYGTYHTKMVPIKHMSMTIAAPIVLHHPHHSYSYHQSGGNGYGPPPPSPVPVPAY